MTDKLPQAPGDHVPAIWFSAYAHLCHLCHLLTGDGHDGSLCFSRAGFSPYSLVRPEMCIKHELESGRHRLVPGKNSSPCQRLVPIETTFCSLFNVCLGLTRTLERPLFLLKILPPLVSSLCCAPRTLLIHGTALLRRRCLSDLVVSVLSLQTAMTRRKSPTRS
jgi:hypothetical protein